MLLCGDELLFAGDTVFQGSIGRTDLAGGDMAARWKRACARSPGLPISPKRPSCCPATGIFPPCGEELANNFYIKARAAECKGGITHEDIYHRACPPAMRWSIWCACFTPWHPSPSLAPEAGEDCVWAEKQPGGPVGAMVRAQNGKETVCRSAPARPPKRRSLCPRQPDLWPAAAAGRASARPGAR